MSKLGVDISYHNGNIDFPVLSRNVEFVIIRAGYGQGNIDAKLQEYVAGCKQNKIPYGFYWFSYAPTVSMAIKEAKYFVDAIKKYSPIYPCFYDYEDESKCGKSVSFTEIYNMASAFTEIIKNNGLIPGIYCDNSYYEGYANKFKKDVDIWYARWNSTKTPPDCAIYQYTDKATIDGIKSKVDANMCYKEYVSYSKMFDLNALTEIMNVFQEEDKKYVGIALKVLSGKYGNGSERIKKLKDENLDPAYVQKIVNILVKYEIKPEG